jgi:large subunit ribosomal protein L35Ae
MEGVISHFRGSYRRRKGNQLIIVVTGVDSEEKANSVVGKSVVWTAPGKNKTQIKGKVSAVHGRNGAVRVIFERGLPGQSLGTQVTLQ